MADERKVYRSPARAQRAVSGAGPARQQGGAGMPPRTPKQPPRKTSKKRRSRAVLGLCAACLVLGIVLAVVLTRCSAGPTGPAKADFGTPAAAWQKNELGYYFNESGEAMPAAVLKGIDVSKYQGAVDWEKAKSNGVDFAIIRCGFGGEWDGQEQGWNQDDPQWRRNADECTRLGIPFGAYIYSYATTEDEARSEADHVARLLGLVAPPQEGLEDYTAAPYRLSYPVYYDLEDKSISGIFPDEMAAITKAFFDRLTELGYTGKQGIYASLNWVRARFSDAAFDPWRENLWIARFADELGYTGTYDMWQCSYSEPGADYGVESETVDIDFVMRPFAFGEISSCNGKTATPTLLNDTRQTELHLDGKDAYANLTTNQPDEENGGQKIFWTTSDKSVATVDKHGLVRAKADSGECTITATLADGTESIQCLVRVGDITVPIFATGSLAGQRANDNVSLADVAALKASTPDSILVDAGGSLHGTTVASMTGGMDMLSSFSAAGYDLQAFGAEDLAYGISRLRSDANMGSGPSLAANLRDSDGAAIFYRSTSWNRNRITNGMNYVITRAGYRIGFFSLADADTVNNKISLVNEETPFANDLTQTASEQVAALQAQGVDAIICIATPGVDTAALQTTLKDLGVTAIVDGSSSASGQDTLYRAGAALGLDGVARFDLVFTQGGGVAVRGADTVTADTLQASRSTWESLTITADDTQTGGDAADPDKDTEAVGGKDTSTPAETVDEAQQQGAEAYAYAAAKLAGLDADDQSIYYTPLFTYAANPDAEKTISFANYLAALYQEIAENDRDHWPEGWTGSEFTALAGNVGEPEYGDISRGTLLDLLPKAARVQLVSVSADTARTLAGLDGVSRTYQESLSEYEPAGDTVLIVTDTQTLASIGTENYTVLRDYGDVYWDVRMNINDLTENFTTDFILPEAPRYGVGRNNK